MSFPTKNPWQLRRYRQVAPASRAAPPAPRAARSSRPGACVPARPPPPGRSCTKVSLASLPCTCHLALDALDLLVQARAFGVEVDQAFQRHQQLQLADHRRPRAAGGVAVGEQFDALEARRGSAAATSKRAARARSAACRRPAAAAPASPAATLSSLRMRRSCDDHRLQPFDVGFGAGVVAAGEVARPAGTGCSDDRVAGDAQLRRDLPARAPR